MMTAEEFTILYQRFLVQMKREELSVKAYELECLELGIENDLNLWEHQEDDMRESMANRPQYYDDGHDYY